LDLLAAVQVVDSRREVAAAGVCVVARVESLAVLVERLYLRLVNVSRLWVAAVQLARAQLNRRDAIFIQ
jgi:hypothetical protein